MAFTGKLRTNYSERRNWDTLFCIHRGVHNAYLLCNLNSLELLKAFDIRAKPKSEYLVLYLPWCCFKHSKQLSENSIKLSQNVYRFTISEPVMYQANLNTIIYLFLLTLISF